MVNVLVTGANGQLGQAIQALAGFHTSLSFCFAGSKEADITDKQSLNMIFKRLKPRYCINAAAYTAVDKAESEQERAFAINAEGARNIAEVCKEYNTVLIHISTDFVFDGTKGKPYAEDDLTNPGSVYGRTKRDGEVAIQNILEQHYIIRTSWLYSQYGNNFMKTMLRLAAGRESLSVVNDQTGTPTNANDLAEAIIQVILSEKQEYGIYHYSNEGETTWYVFAKKIFEINNIAIELQPVTTADYPTPAKRPAYSVLDKGKIKNTFGITIPKWDESLIAQVQ